MALQSLTVCADETLALQLINLADSVRVEMGVGTENLGKEIFDVADVQRVQLKKLLINPIGLTLSFTMSRSLSVRFGPQNPTPFGGEPSCSADGEKNWLYPSLYFFDLFF